MYQYYGAAGGESWLILIRRISGDEIVDVGSFGATHVGRTCGEFEWRYFAPAFFAFRDCLPSGPRLADAEVESVVGKEVMAGFLSGEFERLL